MNCEDCLHKGVCKHREKIDLAKEAEKLSKKLGIAVKVTCALKQPCYDSTTITYIDTGDDIHTYTTCTN